MSYICVSALSAAFQPDEGINLSFYQIGSQKTFHSRGEYVWQLAVALDWVVDANAVLSVVSTLLYVGISEQKTHISYRYDSSVFAIKASGHARHASRQADCQSVSY